MSINHDQAQRNVRDLLMQFEARGYETRLDDSYPNELTGEVAVAGDKALSFTAEPLGELAASIVQHTPESQHGSYVAGLSTYFNPGDEAGAVCEALIQEAAAKGYELQTQRPELGSNGPDAAGADISGDTSPSL